jgi:hypothetical protein
MAGPAVTVMNFSQSFPLDPLPSGWRHQKFWTRVPMEVPVATQNADLALCTKQVAAWLSQIMRFTLDNDGTLV